MPGGVNATQTPPVEVVQGNLLKQDGDIDAIVNPANEQLDNAGGLAARIEEAASPKFKDDCSRLRPVSTGSAKVSAGGGQLKQNHVINAVGPIWQGGNHDEAHLLASVHTAIVRVASQNGLRRVALPPISTGIFNYPAKQAAPVAILATLQALTVYPNVVLVRFVMYLSNDPETDDSKKLPLYEDALKSALAGA